MVKTELWKSIIMTKCNGCPQVYCRCTDRCVQLCHRELTAVVLEYVPPIYHQARLVYHHMCASATGGTRCWEECATRVSWCPAPATATSLFKLLTNNSDFTVNSVLCIPLQRNSLYAVQCSSAKCTVQCSMNNDIGNVLNWGLGPHEDQSAEVVLTWFSFYTGVHIFHWRYSCRIGWFICDIL